MAEGQPEKPPVSIKGYFKPSASASHWRVPLVWSGKPRRNSRNVGVLLDQLEQNSFLYGLLTTSAVNHPLQNLFLFLLPKSEEWLGKVPKLSVAGLYSHVKFIWWQLFSAAGFAMGRRQMCESTWRLALAAWYGATWAASSAVSKSGNLSCAFKP